MKELKAKMKDVRIMPRDIGTGRLLALWECREWKGGIRIYVTSCLNVHFPPSNSCEFMPKTVAPKDKGS